MFEAPITNDNFLLVAMHHYDNVQCSNLSEFEDDLKRFGYLRKLFVRYKYNNELREKLMVNHIIILFNLFGIATPELLFFKIDSEFWSYLATVLVFLNRMPDEIPEFGIKLTDIQLDSTMVEALRKI